MKASNHGILPHHQRPATIWGRGGKDYDEVSFAISDALAHAAQRLNARAGERILDVATGTGWTAMASSPLAWGDPVHVEQLLGRAFELKFEKGISNAYHGSADDIWDWYTRGFGPLRQLAESLPTDRVEGLKHDVMPIINASLSRPGFRLSANTYSPLVTGGSTTRDLAIIGDLLVLGSRRRAAGELVTIPGNWCRLGVGRRSAVGIKQTDTPRRSNVGFRVKGI